MSHKQAIKGFHVSKNPLRKSFARDKLMTHEDWTESRHSNREQAWKAVKDPFLAAKDIDNVTGNQKNTRTWNNTTFIKI